MTKLTAFFKSVSRDSEEYREEVARGFAEARQQAQFSQAKAAFSAEAAAERKRVLARERQRKRRARQYEMEIEEGKRDSNGRLKKRKSAVLSPYTTPKRSSEIDKALKVIYKGSRKGLPRLRARRTNWFHPKLWPAIDAAARKTRFSSVNAVKLLKRQVGGNKLYGTLDPGTFQKWIDTSGEKRDWSAKTKARVEEEGKRNVVAVRLGRPQVLVGRRELRKKIVETLKINRDAGVPITAPVARGLILGLANSMAPDLVADKQFKCSRAFVHRLLQNELGYSWRTSTRAAHKLPRDWEKQCELAFFRLVYHMVINRVPVEAIINADQMGVTLLPVGNKTWAPEGARQVDMVGKEEKRQFTVMVTTTCSGEILPMQCIWSGKTEASLPSRKAREEAEKEGFLFTPGGANHWSSIPSMKAWLDNIVVPYLQRVKEKKNLPQLTGVLLIDCWKVHRSDAFRALMKKEYKWLRLVFVPGGCTGKFQPNDVGIQRILKHIVRAEATDFIVNQIKAQVNANRNAKVTLNPSIGVLRDASIGWILKAFRHFRARRDLVLKAWEHCKAFDWILTEKCLRSDRAICSMQEQLDDDPSFALSVASTIKAMSEADHEAEDELVDGDNFEDDVAISVDELVNAMEATAGPNVIQTDDGGFTITGGLDDQVAEEDDGSGSESEESEGSDDESVAIPSNVQICAVEGRLQDLWMVDPDQDENEHYTTAPFDGSSERRVDAICMVLRWLFDMHGHKVTFELLCHEISIEDEALGDGSDELHPAFTRQEIWDCVCALKAVGIISIEPLDE